VQVQAQGTLCQHLHAFQVLALQYEVPLPLLDFLHKSAADLVALDAAPACESSDDIHCEGCLVADAECEL